MAPILSMEDKRHQLTHHFSQCPSVRVLSMLRKFAIPYF